MKTNQLRNQAALAAGLLLLAIPPAAAGVVGVLPVTSESWSVGVPIPDDDPVGVADTRVITGSEVGFITGLSVSLQISGGYGGDLYASLAHETGFSVLLNRVGRSSTNLLGDGATSFDVVLWDDAPTDIHRVSSGFGPVTGLYQPDGRDVSPLSVFDTTPRTAPLGNFDGLSANGSWTLFVADVSGADQATLEGWGLEITGLVPEPSSVLLLSCAFCGFLARRRRA